MISIGVTTYQRKKLTKCCINTIHKCTPRKSYELIVVDNSSTDGTREMLVNMMRRGIIDNLILNDENKHLASAINQFYKSSSPRSEWLIAFSNDNLVMKGWYENFLKVSSDLHAYYIFCVMRPPVFHLKERLVTKSGGVHMKRLGPPEEAWFPFGSGVAIKRELVFKHDLWFDEKKKSPYSTFLKKVYEKGLEGGYELGKPCALTQNCEFNNPEYREYYIKVFKSRGKLDRYKRLRESVYYTDFPEEYYKGSGYEWRV